MKENWKYLVDENLFKGTANNVVAICLKGDKPKNTNFTAEARRWLRFTYDRYFEGYDIPPYLGCP